MKSPPLSKLLIAIAFVFFLLALITLPDLADKKIILDWYGWIALGSAFFAIGHIVE